MMKTETTGMVFLDTCHVRTERCVARSWDPVTAVIGPDGSRVHTCRPCLEEAMRQGEWLIRGARLEQRFDVAVLGADYRERLLIDARVTAPHRCRDAEAWAKRVHYGLMHYSGLPGAAAYMLIGYPDRFFVWTFDRRDREDAPAYSAHDPSVLAPFLHLAGGASDAAARKRVVTAWIEAVLDQPFGTTDLARWMGEAGVLRPLREVARQRVAA